MDTLSSRRPLHSFLTPSLKRRLDAVARLGRHTLPSAGLNRDTGSKLSRCVSLCHPVITHQGRFLSPPPLDPHNPRRGKRMVTWRGRAFTSPQLDCGPGICCHAVLEPGYSARHSPLPPWLCPHLGHPSVSSFVHSFIQHLFILCQSRAKRYARTTARSPGDREVGAVTISAITAGG